MESKIPKATGRLREFALELARDPAVAVNRANQALLDYDETYAGLQPSVKHDVREFVAFSVRLWLKTILQGESPSEDELRQISDAGRRRVHQGVSLPSLLRAFRLGSREIWGTLLEFGAQDADVREQLLMAFSPYLLDYFDVMAQRIAAAYMDEQYQRARWRDALRYELLSIIFSFPEDAAAFRRATDALGLDATVPRVAMAMDISMPDVLPSRMEGELDRLQLAISRTLKINLDDLIRTVHRGRLIVWLPTIRGDSILATDNHMRRFGLDIIASVSEIKTIGIGLLNTGAHGWMSTLEESFRALESGRRLRAPGRVFLYSDFILNESVLRTHNALRYLDSLLERLAHEPDLLLTLTSYFDLGQHRKQVSAALGVHPNTLNYRLARIEEILGAQLSDANWLAKLHVAVKLRHVSDSSSTTGERD